MTLKVIGAGFGRTGTLSLKSALETLHLGPCYHMIEVFSRPDAAEQWLRATSGGRVDWDEIYGDYQATVDWPGCAFRSELIVAYREAKVVLSVRDAEKWWESASAASAARSGASTTSHPSEAVRSCDRSLESAAGGATTGAASKGAPGAPPAGRSTRDAANVTHRVPPRRSGGYRLCSAIPAAGTIRR